VAHNLEIELKKITVYKNKLAEEMSRQIKYTKSYKHFSTNSYYNTRELKSNKNLYIYIYILVAVNKEPLRILLYLPL